MIARKKAARLLISFEKIKIICGTAFDLFFLYFKAFFPNKRMNNLFPNFQNQGRSIRFLLKPKRHALWSIFSEICGTIFDLVLSQTYSFLSHV